MIRKEKEIQILFFFFYQIRISLNLCPQDYYRECVVHNLESRLLFLRGAVLCRVRFVEILFLSAYLIDNIIVKRI